MEGDARYAPIALQRSYCLSGQHTDCPVWKGQGELEGGLDGQIDEPPFLLGGDHARRHAGGLPGRPEEIPAVAGLTHRRGGGAQDPIDLVAPCQLHEAGQGFHAGADRRGAQATRREGAAPDLDHLALTVDHLEGGERGGLGDHHVDRVGPDVDGRDLHSHLRAREPRHSLRASAARRQAEPGSATAAMMWCASPTIDRLWPAL